MFFLLSKILGFIASPSNVIALVIATGLCLLLLKWRRAGAVLLTAGIVALLVAGFSPAGNILLLTLSDRFPAWQYRVGRRDRCGNIGRAGSARDQRIRGAGDRRARTGAAVFPGTHRLRRRKRKPV